MGISTRKDDVRAAWQRSLADGEARADAERIITAWNARLANNQPLLFSPTVGAALLAKHHWLSVVCDACGMVTHLDVSMKRRDPDMPLTLLVPEALCPRCNGDGQPRPVALSRWPSD